MIIHWHCICVFDFIGLYSCSMFNVQEWMNEAAKNL